jgi:hypothetical protein
MGEVPDLLVTAQFLLKPLAKGQSPATAEDAQRIIGEACDLIDLALANVLDISRNLPDLTRLIGLVAAVDRLPAADAPPGGSGAGPRQ